MLKYGAFLWNGSVASCQDCGLMLEEFKFYKPEQNRTALYFVILKMVLIISQTFVSPVKVGN